MLNLIEALMFAIAGYGIAITVEMIRVSFIDIYNKTNFKPFNCRICLTFWSVLLLSFLIDFNLIKAIIYAFFSISIANILKILEDKNESI